MMLLFSSQTVSFSPRRQAGPTRSNPPMALSSRGRTHSAQQPSPVQWPTIFPIRPTTSLSREQPSSTAQQAPEPVMEGRLCRCSSTFHLLRRGLQSILAHCGTQGSVYGAHTPLKLCPCSKSHLARLCCLLGSVPPSRYIGPGALTSRTCRTQAAPPSFLC